MSLQTENEKLRTRLGEMAAEVECLTTENARLRAEIDSANAQEPTYMLLLTMEDENRLPCGVYWDEVSKGVYKKYEIENGDKFCGQVFYARPIPAQQSIDRQSIIDILVSSKNISDGILADLIVSSIGSRQIPWLQAIYEALAAHHIGVVDAADTYDQAKQKLNLLLCAAESIGALQSPAVAVPDCIEASLTWLDAALTCKSFIWDGDQYDAAKYELEQAKLWLEKKSANPSPRITEQDAREIAESCLAYWLYKNPMEFHVGDWLSSKGRALLNKLNEANHAR